jgi:hypothetical protein
MQRAGPHDIPGAGNGLTGFEGAACHLPLAQVAQVASHLLLAELIG